jgi:glyoxylase-like metal-dependent hydrolase (beta-lactamase superfamily II)
MNMNEEEGEEVVLPTSSSSSSSSFIDSTDQEVGPPLSSKTTPMTGAKPVKKLTNNDSKYERQAGQVVSQSLPSLASLYSTSRPTKKDASRQPLKKRSLLSSIAQQIREIRHTYTLLMSILSTIVLLTLLLSYITTLLLYTIPQYILFKILLRPIIQYKYWIVQFLYRTKLAKWGHVKLLMLMEQQSMKKQQQMTNKGGGDKAVKRSIRSNGGVGRSIKNSNNTSTTSTQYLGEEKEIGADGHSWTINQRITVVPNRIYIHPIPQFTDNIAYLIVCTPPLPLPSTAKVTTKITKAATTATTIISRKINTTSSDENNVSSSTEAAAYLPIICLIIDCGESDRVLRYMERIYKRYYIHDYPPPPTATDDNNNTMKMNMYSNSRMQLYGILCTHHHHDHTAGVISLQSEILTRREKKSRVVSVSTGCYNSSSSKESDDIYMLAPGNLVIVGGAIENVPNCNLYVKNGCYIPLPCVTVKHEVGDNNSNSGTTSNVVMMNDMNDIVSIEVIGTPGHTRGSVVYALRNRLAPGITTYLTNHNNNSSMMNDPSSTSPPSSSQQLLAPLQSHLFTGDVIFCGGCGVPFEADLQHPNDDFIANPAAIKSKHGSSVFRPSAGMLSMERCFIEVLTRANGTVVSSTLPPTSSSPAIAVASNKWSSKLLWKTIKPSSRARPIDGMTDTTSTTTTLLYPGHEYTTDLLLRQFNTKAINSEIHWNRLSPSTFFTIASHYLVSAHRRALPIDQRLLTIPTPLERELIVNPNYRMLRRRGECLIDALKLWYEFGAKGKSIIDYTTTTTNNNNNCNTDDILVDDEIVENDDVSILSSTEKKKRQQQQQQQSSHNYPTLPSSVFTTVYTTDLQTIVLDLRNGKIDAATAANELELLHTKLDDKLIGRRSIPRTLPSSKNVYLGIVAITMLGSAPSAMTVSDASIMNLVEPMDSTDRVLISKSRVSKSVL